MRAAEMSPIINEGFNFRVIHAVISTRNGGITDAKQFCIRSFKKERLEIRYWSNMIS